VNISQPNLRSEKFDDDDDYNNNNNNNELKTEWTNLTIINLSTSFFKHRLMNMLGFRYISSHPYHQHKMGIKKSSTLWPLYLR